MGDECRKCIKKKRDIKIECEKEDGSESTNNALRYDSFFFIYVI